MNTAMEGKYSHSFSDMTQELKAQMSIANPTIVGLLFYKIPWLVSLHFVAELGPDALAAAALATTLCNVTGMSFAVGLGYGLATLTGQAKGDLLLKGEVKVKAVTREEKAGETVADISTSTVESTPLLESQKALEIDQSSSSISACKAGGEGVEDEEEEDVEHGHEDIDDGSPLLPMVYLYRGIFVQFLFVIPVGIWYIQGIKPMLLWLGQGEQLSLMTDIYLRVLTPGLWSYCVNWTFTSWLSSIDMADVTAWSSILGFSLHVPFNILFVDVLGYGYEGVAMATVMFQLIQPFATCLYLSFTTTGRERMLEKTGARSIGRTRFDFCSEVTAAVSSLAGLRQYVALALPGVVVISEWWASEICIFFAGRLQPNPNYPLGSMSIYQSINTFCFMFPVGFSSAASARVGMFLGKNEPGRADLASKVSLCGAATLSVLLGCTLMFTPHTFFPSLFTSDEGIINETAATISFSAFYVMADGMQSALTGNLKGCGRQALAMPVVVVAYWFVGVPFAYYNAFIKHGGRSELCEEGQHFCGITGLVAGTTLGTYLHFLGLLCVYIFAVHWDGEAAKAQERISLEKREKKRKLEQQSKK